MAASPGGRGSVADAGAVREVTPMSDKFLDFVLLSDEVANLPAVKAALLTMAQMQTVERPGPNGIETVRIADLTADERALLLGMLVKHHRERMD
ncbi:hypothetical protein [Bradyrhizobium ottawaense]|uniref:hypothetical protein n=1 Tax=Bradyrhizobium ottawaense TaxID=931866 RepID=UPI0030F3D7A5